MSAIASIGPFHFNNSLSWPSYWAFYPLALLLIQSPILFDPKMADSVLKEARELLKEKENEVTWFKIFGIFERLLKIVKSKEDVHHVIPQVLDLHLRSIQSDRTRLNGICLDFLKSCAAIAQNNYSFNVFVPVLIRLTGKANKVFVTRAMDAINAVCKYVEMKCIIRNISEFIDSPNKNVRLAVFRIIEMRQGEAQDTLSMMIEKGMRDPAQEVRGICKGMAAVRIEKPVVEREIKKSVLATATPRKSFKVDTAHREIKRLETAVMKITKEQVVSKPISSDFFEKLSQLKRDRKPIVESKEYDLTPRRLDRYLNKYRVSSPVERGVADYGRSVTDYNKTTDYKNEQNSLAQSMPTIGIEIPDNAEIVEEISTADVTENIKAFTDQNVGTAQATFLCETQLFKNELGSSNCNDDQPCDAPIGDDASLIHKMADASSHLEIQASEKSVEVEIINDYNGISTGYSQEDVTDGYNCSIMMDRPADISFCGGEYISELSHSFANMSLEPNVGMREMSPEAVRCSGVVESRTAKSMSCLELIDEYSVPSDRSGHAVASAPDNNSQEASVEEASIENYRSGAADTSCLAPTIRTDAISIGEPAIDFQSIENNENTPHPKQPNATLVISERNISLEDVFGEIDVPSLGHFDDNVTSFIGKISQSINTGDSPRHVTNINDTVIINVVQNRDLSDVFRQQTDLTRHSCVDLFNEPIFSSDEEEIYVKKTPVLKDRPSFVIDIPHKSQCEGSSMNIGKLEDDAPAI